MTMQVYDNQHCKTNNECPLKWSLFSLYLAPCAPSNVQTSLLCDIHNGSVVSVSWVQANGAEAFMAVAVSNDGHSYSCNTTTASCNLQELQCGQNYNVSVYSMASGCGGVKSTMSQVQTGACVRILLYQVKTTVCQLN